MYSLHDLKQVQDKSLPKYLVSVVEQLARHITKECNRCMAHGFICELCRHPTPIYAFDILKTVQCRSCKALYHRHCYTKREKEQEQEDEIEVARKFTLCPKCARLSERKKLHTCKI